MFNHSLYIIDVHTIISNRLLSQTYCVGVSQSSNLAEALPPQSHVISFQLHLVFYQHDTDHMSWIHHTTLLSPKIILEILTSYLATKNHREQYHQRVIHYAANEAWQIRIKVKHTQSNCCISSLNVEIHKVDKTLTKPKVECVTPLFPYQPYLTLTGNLAEHPFHLSPAHSYYPNHNITS